MKLDDETVITRYKRALNDATPEHDRIVKVAMEYYQAYGLNSIGGKDFADLSKVWGDNPPEIGMMLSNVNTFWGQLVSSRREPMFPGFDQSPGDEVVGEMLTELLKAGRRWAGSDAVDEEALMDLILTGYGFAEDFLETDVRPPYRPDDRYVPLSDIWWDTAGNEKNLKDGQEFIRRHRYSFDEAAARFPDSEAQIEALRSDAGGGGGSTSAPGEGARALGGKTVSVSVGTADGKSSGGSRSRRLREVGVDDFQFLVWETLMAWSTDAGGGVETTAEEFDTAMQQKEEEAAQQGQVFQRPPANSYAQGTWYRARILAQSPAGEPTILVSAVPIPGNQPLIKAMTGYPERYLDNDVIKTRYFAFGKVLLGLQRLTSVAIRLEIEQEARRNRSGGDIEEDAFDDETARRAYIDAKAVPGSWPTIPSGSADKIHPNNYTASPHVSSMQQLFQFFSVSLPSHMLGISDMTRGTFQDDRSAKFVSTQQEAALVMQTRLTTSFTAYSQKGALTMLRLMLGPEGLDPPDIDRLLGNQPLFEGVTGQRDPQSGELVPVPDVDEKGQPVIDPATGQPANVTIGGYLKKNCQQIFDNDITIGMRESTASERMANAQLTTQHGFFDNIIKALPPGAAKILIPAMLKASWAPGTIYAEAADKLETFLKQQEEQEQQQQATQTQQGWLQYLQGLVQSDPQTAQQLVQQAEQAVGGGQGQQQGGQNGKPPSESVAFKDLPVAGKIQMAAQAGIQLTPQDFASDPSLGMAGGPPMQPPAPAPMPPAAPPPGLPA